MNLTELVELMLSKQYTLKMGTDKLSKKYSTSPETIREARKEVKQILRSQQGEFPKNTFNTENILIDRLPKILIFDTETAPMRAYVWKRWKENISLDQTISEWFMLAWSAKWLYSGEVLGDHLTGEEALNEDDSRIVKGLWKLIDEADIVIAHNGRKADVPWMNSRFIMNGLVPPKPYFLIDTLDVVKKQFGFSSNKLDALAGYFGIPHKMDTDFDLWKRCMEGDDEALQYMGDYNKKDTAILELVYLKLRPWIKAHPNVGNYIESNEPVCSTCGSSALEELEGQYYYTSVCKYKLYRCKDCGTVVRGRENLNLKSDPKNDVPIVSPGH
jgi:hypothetical protein